MASRAGDGAEKQGTMSEYASAIFESGGKQYRAAVGGVAVVDRLPGEVGANLRLEKVLALAGADGKTEFGAPYLPAAVAVTVLEHLRGEKVRIVKVRRRKNSRRSGGARADLTKIQIDGIVAAGGGAGEKAVAENKNAKSGGE